MRNLLFFVFILFTFCKEPKETDNSINEISVPAVTEETMVVDSIKQPSTYKFNEKIAFSNDIKKNTRLLQRLLDKGGLIDLTSYKDTIKISTQFGNKINALIIKRALYLKFNYIQLTGASDSIPFHLFNIKHGNFDVTIDGNCLPPIDGSPKQPSYSYKFPNILDTWTYNSPISTNGFSRIITLKNSKNTKGYWCSIIKNTGGGINKDSLQVFRLENVNHITRSGGIKMFSGNQPFSRLEMRDVKLRQLIKKDQKHHDHLGYIHENVNSHFENVELFGCHFDFRSTQWQNDEGVTHYFKNVYMHDGLSMNMKNGSSDRTNSKSYFENCKINASAVYSHVTLKDTWWRGGTWNSITTLGGNILLMPGQDKSTTKIDFSKDSIAMGSFRFLAPNANVIIKKNTINSRIPKVTNGKLLVQ